MIVSILNIIASGGWWQRTIGYKVIGNETWRFLLILLVVLIAMVVGKIVQFSFNSFADRRDKKRGVTSLTLFLRCLTKPISVAFFAVALFISKVFMLFGEEAISPAI